MTRTVVSFERFGDHTVFKLEDAPTDVPGIGDNAVADISPLPGGSIVDQGKVLLDRLCAHPPVKAGLDAIFSLPPNAGPAPLYFHMIASAADALPWEQLYLGQQQGFCALDRRWPVGRVASRRRPVTDRAFTPPLRIVAVLSAAGRSGMPQLQTLLQAAASADAAAIGTRIHVISGEQEVLDAVTAAARPEVTAELIAPTAPALGRQIAAAKPHVLHMLCHGGAVAGVRTLAFGTLADFDAGDETGSVRLKVADLVSVLLPCDPWLVILAACESAETAGQVDAPALAHDMASSGIPAVIGMRRMMDLGDTNNFCAGLYPELLVAVRAALEPGGPPGVRTIDWAAMLTAPRLALGGADPSTVDTWSDPVLYVQDDPLRVFPPSPTMSPAQFAELRARLDFWTGFLATLDAATTDPGVLAEVQGRVTELRAKLAQAGGT